MRARAIWLRLVLVVFGAWWTTGAFAHQTVVSPFTYYHDVKPILERQCGRCHGDGGVSSIPLLQYAGARAVSWPLRQALTAGTMPPWFGESGRAALKGSQSLRPQELNVLMTWAAGGAPEGKPEPETAGTAAMPAPPPPDLVISMPEVFTLRAETSAADYEVALPSEGARGQWIRAIDVLPGTPTIARRATIIARRPGGEQVVGLWIPGDPPLPLEGQAAFQIQPDASLILRVHYERRLGDPARTVTDRSRVAVYLADPATAKAVDVVDLESPSTRIDRRVRAVAVRAVDGPIDDTINLVVVSPGGARRSLLRMQTPSAWPRRYVFVAPVTIEMGSRIEMRAEPSSLVFWRSGETDRSVDLRNAAKKRVALEIIP
jgi:hypothetical protein